MAKAKKVARKAAKPVGRVSPRAPGKKAPRHASAAPKERLSPVPLMQLATAFWAFGTLAAAVELDLFSKISGAGTIVPHHFARPRGFTPARGREFRVGGCLAHGTVETRGRSALPSVRPFTSAAFKALPSPAGYYGLG